MKKQMMIEALRRFINQRSGIEFGNYQSGDWKASREAFMGDYRPIVRHGRHARTLLRAVELRDSITAAALKDASRAYSGRLQFEQRNGAVAVDYTTGQYFPTEYRNAACAVLASALWAHYRKNMPKANGATTRTHGTFTSEHETYDGLTAGEWIRREARREFGPAIAKTWFN